MVLRIPYNFYDFLEGNENSLKVLKILERFYAFLEGLRNSCQDSSFPAATSQFHRKLAEKFRNASILLPINWQSNRLLALKSQFTISYFPSSPYLCTRLCQPAATCRGASAGLKPQIFIKWLRNSPKKRICIGTS